MTVCIARGGCVTSPLTIGHGEAGTENIAHSVQHDHLGTRGHGDGDERSPTENPDLQRPFVSGINASGYSTLLCD